MSKDQSKRTECVEIIGSNGYRCDICPNTFSKLYTPFSKAGQSITFQDRKRGLAEHAKKYHPNCKTIVLAHENPETRSLRNKHGKKLWLDLNGSTYWDSEKKHTEAEKVREKQANLHANTIKIADSDDPDDDMIPIAKIEMAKDSNSTITSSVGWLRL